VWDVQTGQLVMVMNKSSDPTGWSEMISLDWSPEGSRIASGYLNGDIIIWNAISGERLFTIREYVSHRSDANGLDWSPDGKFLATAHQDGITRVWETTNYTLSTKLTGTYGWMRGVAWSPDGSRIATTGEDYAIRIWDAASGRLIASGKPGTFAIWAVAWSPEGTRLAIGEGFYGNQTVKSSIYILAAP
jgi:WD40 repeat protein